MTARVVLTKSWNFITWPFKKIWDHVGILVVIIIIGLLCYGGYRLVDLLKNSELMSSSAASSTAPEKVRVVQAHREVEVSNDSASQSSTQAIPVHACNRSAVWDGDRKVWSDASGDFITPPNLFVWRTDFDVPCWHAPFSEFAELYPEQAAQIIQQNHNRSAEYLNEKNIVRKYGKVAIPPRR